MCEWMNVFLKNAVLDKGPLNALLLQLNVEGSRPQLYLAPVVSRIANFFNVSPNLLYLYW